MDKEAIIKEAYCYTFCPLEQAALRCMLRGDIPFDEQFCKRILQKST